MLVWLPPVVMLAHQGLACSKAQQNESKSGDSGSTVAGHPEGAWSHEESSPGERPLGGQFLAAMPAGWFLTDTPDSSTCL
jgi:hypothetical protein